MKRRALPAIAGILAAALLTGCTMTIPQLSPQPNVALVGQQRSLALAFGPNVPDRFSVAYYNVDVQVQSWRATLDSGFRAGVRGAYQPSQGPTTDLTLTLDSARLEFGDFRGSRARIQYQATLAGADGTVRRSAGTASRAAPAFAGGAATSTELLSANIEASVAAMVEQIAKELLTDPAPIPRPAGCVPGQSTGCGGRAGCHGFQVCASDGTRYEPCVCGD